MIFFSVGIQVTILSRHSLQCTMLVVLVNFSILRLALVHTVPLEHSHLVDRLNAHHVQPGTTVVDKDTPTAISATLEHILLVDPQLALHAPRALWLESTAPRLVKLSGLDITLHLLKCHTSMAAVMLAAKELLIVTRVPPHLVPPDTLIGIVTTLRQTLTPINAYR